MIDRLLKSLAAKPVKKILEGIPHPAKITKLKDDMGLANDKKNVFGMPSKFLVVLSLFV